MVALDLRQSPQSGDLVHWIGKFQGSGADGLDDFGVRPWSRSLLQQQVDIGFCEGKCRYGSGKDGCYHGGYGDESQNRHVSYCCTADPDIAPVAPSNALS